MARSQRGPPTPKLELSHPSQPSWRSCLPGTGGADPPLHPPDIGPGARNECCVPCTLLPKALSHPPFYSPPGPRRGKAERPRFRYRSHTPGRGPSPTVPPGTIWLWGLWELTHERRPRLIGARNGSCVPCSLLASTGTRIFTHPTSLKASADAVVPPLLLGPPSNILLYAPCDAKP